MPHLLLSLVGEGDSIDCKLRCPPFALFIGENSSVLMVMIHFAGTLFAV
jgi:hypothetical protein